MAIYQITSDRIETIRPTTFADAGLRERADLQRLLRSQIDILAGQTGRGEDGLLVVAEEFGEWEDARRRIDLLAIDKQANLVVIELKRTDDGGHMDLQAIRYAAMVSAMTFDKVVDVFERHLRSLGRDEDAERALLEFLEWEEPDEESFAQDVRIVLASAEFSKELTTAVIWLNDRGLDIRCVRLAPYSDNGRVLLDVQQVIPLPEAEQYQVQLREKNRQELRTSREKAERHTLRRKFWGTLLERAKARTPLHANLSPTDSTWLGTPSRLNGAGWLNYVINQHEGRVELYLSAGRDSSQQNKARFHELMRQRHEIDKDFGGPLEWLEWPDRQASKVTHRITLGGYRDGEEKWPRIQDAMIDAMIRLERALVPRLPDRAG